MTFAILPSRSLHLLTVIQNKTWIPEPCPSTDLAGYLHRSHPAIVVFRMLRSMAAGPTWQFPPTKGEAIGRLRNEARIQSGAPCREAFDGYQNDGGSVCRVTSFLFVVCQPDWSFSALFPLTDQPGVVSQFVSFCSWCRLCAHIVTT